MEFFDDDNTKKKPKQPSNKTPGKTPPKPTSQFSLDGLDEDELDHKPFPVKKVAIIASILLLLGGGGFGGFKVYQNYTRKQEQIQQEKDQIKKILENLESGIKTFSIDTEENNNWNLNKNYAKSDLVNSFLDKFANRISVEVSGSNATISYPNWTYLEDVLKNLDVWTVKEMTKHTKASDFDHTEQLERALFTYLNDNLDQILDNRDSYVSNLVATMQEEEPPFKTMEASGSDWRDGNKINTKFADELDKTIFGDEFRSFLNTFSTIASSAIDTPEPTTEYTSWKGREDILLDYIQKTRELVQDQEDPGAFWGNHVGLDSTGLIEKNTKKDDDDKDNKDNKDNKDDKDDKAEEDEAAPTNLAIDEVPTDASTDYTPPKWRSEHMATISALDAYRELLKIKPKPYELDTKGIEWEKTIPHSILGVSYIKSDKSDAVSQEVMKGDGSYDSPYTIGTPFTTKMLSTDGNYYDVKVTLTKVLTDEEAIEDALTFDEKNQGFTMESEFKLATIHFTVENLTEEDIEVNSEWTLGDKDLNLTPRTGSVFSFKERATIPARTTVEMSDWLNARETHTQALIWGKSFNREFPAVFVNALGNQVFDTVGQEQERQTKDFIQNVTQDAQKSLEEQVLQPAEEPKEEDTSSSKEE